MNERITPQEITLKGTVHLFGYEEAELPYVLKDKPPGKVVVFQKIGKKIKKVPATAGADVRRYKNALEIQRTEADVCFLDHEALGILAVKYPAHPQYVLARIAFR